MGVKAITTIGALTIPSGQTSSNILDAQQTFADAETLTIFAPATLDAGVTFTLQAAYKTSPASTDTWNNLNNGLQDVTAPPAGKAVSYPTPPCSGLRITAGSAVAADRTFLVTKQFFMGE